jgi:hypothetical protein
MISLSNKPDNYPTNKDRAEWALRTVAYFTSIVGGDDLETEIVDLIANILHLCDQEDIDHEPVLRMAAYHHEEEVLIQKEQEEEE